MLRKALRKVLLPLLCMSLMLSPPLSAQQQDGTAQLAQQANDRGWPRGYSLASEAQVLIYQPQVASWQDQKHLVAFAAVSHVAKGDQKPALGVIKLEADTSVALERRLVKFSTFKITEANFQTLPKEQTRELVSEIEKTIPDEDRVIALDRVLSYVDRSQISPKNVKNLNTAPPKIFLTRTPAILLGFDGEPIWSPIKDNELKFAVNTNWDVFQHGPTGLYYLRNENSWLGATALSGPWSYANKLPDSFNKLPADDNWKDVRANLSANNSGPLPSVYYSIEPAELIVIDGAPKVVPVPGTRLLWISNTESDLFRLGADGPVFYLVAGRWFRAPNFNGNWVFATPNLPEDFQRISLEHPRSRVLASVPGTQQDQNGNWSKWNNGSWNQVQRPDRPTQRADMLNDQAREQLRQSERNQARGERTGQSKRSQMDNSTYRSLERDRAGRTEGSRRTSDYGSYNRGRSGGGSYRSGGFRGGGGGFRGGSRRR